MIVGAPEEIGEIGVLRDGEVVLDHRVGLALGPPRDAQIVGRHVEAGTGAQGLHVAGYSLIKPALRVEGVAEAQLGFGEIRPEHGSKKRLGFAKATGLILRQPPTNDQIVTAGVDHHRFHPRSVRSAHCAIERNTSRATPVMHPVFEAGKNEPRPLSDDAAPRGILRRPAGGAFGAIAGGAKGGDRIDGCTLT